ncbi:MAG TPA: hypothetical protein DEG96_06005 [Candidatus Atribacteria bacterium]|uniref:Uncharacterized protein n=1 Tax=candidate division TA06 bacterium 34_109 TaxID=1635277 RepID=A0A101I0D3_UNCT6|nr:MAG: hypothetical protein XE03_1477 [candidate division TA06 bacterium 34_109]HBY57399.1 hypothetical protein [Candidatus Atribacteria bacterium]
MKKDKKKEGFTTLFIIILIVVACFPLRAFAERVEIGKTYWVEKSEKNGGIELTVFDCQLKECIGEEEADSDEIFIIISTLWQNIIPPVKKEISKSKDKEAGGLGFGVSKSQEQTQEVELFTPYLVENLQDNMYLIINNKHIAQIDEVTNELSAPLPLKDLTLPEYEDELEGRIVFRSYKEEINSLLLVFFDFEQGHIQIPLMELPEAKEEIPPLITQENEYLKISFYGIKPQGDICLIDLGVESVSKGNVIDLDFGQNVFLIEDGLYQYEALETEEMPFSLYGFTRFIPYWERRGYLAFKIPPIQKNLSLLVNIPRAESLIFNLNPKIPISPLPKPFTTIVDGEVAKIDILGLTRADMINGQYLEKDQQYLILDIIIHCIPLNQGNLILQSGEQFILIDQLGNKYSISEVTQNIRHGIKLEQTVPAGTARRFNLVYEVPLNIQKITLYYRGFTLEENIPIEVK